MAYPLVGVILSIIDAAGNPVTDGSAVFTPTSTVSGTDGIDEVAPLPVTVRLDNGAFPVSVTLIPTDAALTPGWAWQVSFDKAGLNSFTFEAPAGPAAFTAAAGTPGTVTWTATTALTSLPPGTGVKLTGGSLPAGVTSGTTYYVVSPSGQTLSLSATAGGSPIAFAGSGAGTLTVVSYYLAGLAPAGSAARFSPYLLAPAGTPGAGQVLTATGSGSGTEWSDPAGAVDSVFGRTGAVTAHSGDYTAAQVGAVPAAAAGAANGVAALDSGGHVPSAQLPAASTGAKGAVQLGGGTVDFLRGDGSWAVPPGGSGTVVSVNDVEPDGDGNVALTAADTGAVAVGALFWNARDHGVTGDGATVDSAALQALVITVATAGGGTIYLPAGTYIISAVYLASNITLLGAGMGATVLKLDPAATPGTNAIVIRVANGSTTAASWVTVRNLTIDGNKSAFPSPAGKVYGYYLGTGTTGLVTDCLVEGVEFRNCPTYALDIVDAVRVSVTDCFSHDNGVIGGGTNDACSGFEILADDVTLTSCRAVNNAVKGFTSGEGGVAHFRTKLIGCTAQLNGQDGMYFHDGLTDSAILGGTARDNAGSGVVLATSAVRNTVVGVTSSGNAVNGFRVDSGTFNILSACIADGNAAASSGNPEIYLVSGAANNSVIGCMVNSVTSSTSIVEHDTADHNVFRNNTYNKTFTLLGANSTIADPGIATLDGSAKLTASQVPATVALLASPAFSGTPTAPTQTAADNSTKIATTAYADGAVAAAVISAGGFPVVATTGLAGYTYVNGTGTILTWTAPSDGQMHDVQFFGQSLITSATTGGGISVTYTTPDGTSHSSTLSTAPTGTGTKQFGFDTLTTGPGGTVTVTQSSALTAGAATLWLDIRAG